MTLAILPLQNVIPRYGIAVVHMQEGYLATVEPHEKTPILYRTRELIEHAAEHDLPVALIEMESMDRRATNRWEPGTTDPFLCESRTSNFRRVFRIASPDGFRHPELAPWYRSHGANTIVCVGLWARGCVTTTADGAYGHEFAVNVLEDCVLGTHARALLKRRHMQYTTLDQWRSTFS